MYSVDTKLVFEIVFKYHGKYLYLYLNTILIQVFAIVIVFGKFLVFVFVFNPLTRKFFFERNLHENMAGRHFKGPFKA